MEFTNVTINKKFYDLIKLLSEQRKTENKKYKNDPTEFYEVLSEYEKIVDWHEEHDEERLVLSLNNKNFEFSTIEEVKNFLKKDFPEVLLKINKEQYLNFSEISEIINENIKNAYSYERFSVWDYSDVSCFLTRQEAEEYIEKQKNNLRNPIIVPKKLNDNSLFKKLLKVLTKENIFTNTIEYTKIDDWNIKDDYKTAKNENQDDTIYLCAVCGNQITLNENGICNACQDHKEYENGEYENREKIIITE